MPLDHARCVHGVPLEWICGECWNCIETTRQVNRKSGYWTEENVMTSRDIVPGNVWQHYKGGRYEIVCVAKIEANLEECVVYRSLTDHGAWVRSKSGFLEKLPTGGWRFERLAVVPSGQ